MLRFLCLQYIDTSSSVSTVYDQRWEDNSYSICLRFVSLSHPMNDCWSLLIPQTLVWSNSDIGEISNAIQFLNLTPDIEDHWSTPHCLISMKSLRHLDCLPWSRWPWCHYRSEGEGQPHSDESACLVVTRPARSILYKKTIKITTPAHCDSHHNKQWLTPPQATCRSCTGVRGQSNRQTWLWSHWSLIWLCSGRIVGRVQSLCVRSTCVHTPACA